MIKNKHILAIDFIIIFGSLVLLAGVIGYTRPLVISPINKLVTTNNSVLFSFEKGNTILIDENIDFSSPVRIDVKDSVIINLKPGVYYWKIEGIGESKVRQLTIKSNVELMIKQVKDSYGVVNAGNVNLDVGFYEKGKFLRNDTLGIDESKKVEGTKVVGRENE